MREIFAPITNRLGNSNSDYTRHVARTILSALKSPTSGTMRAWMEQNNGRNVTTVQVNRRDGSAWAPTGRTINAGKATYVELGESRRDYAGMKVCHATGDCLIVSDSWHAIAYIIEN